MVAKKKSGWISNGLAGRLGRAARCFGLLLFLLFAADRIRATEIIEFSYDERGRLVAMIPTDNTGSLRFYYGGAGNPVSVTGMNDQDGDGMDDQWEIFWFGSLDQADAFSDSDGNGVPDWMEFASGTLPLEAQSLLRVHPPGPAGPDGAWFLRWPTAYRSVYAISWTTNLAGPWTRAAAGLVGTGGVIEQAVTAATGRVYFRIAVEGRETP